MRGTNDNITEGLHSMTEGLHRTIYNNGLFDNMDKGLHLNMAEVLPDTMTEVT